MTDQKKPGSKKLLAPLKKYLVAGLTVLAPIAGTIILLVFIFEKVDNILQPPIGGVIRWFNPDFHATIPGLGVIASALIIIVTGMIASNYAGRQFLKQFESLLIKVPVLKQVYLAAQQVTKGITGLSIDKAAFRKVVFIEFPVKGALCPCFVTNEVKDQGGKRYYCLYFPTPPNPFSGYFILAEEDKVMESDMSVTAAFKMDITGGLLSPSAIDVIMPAGGPGSQD